MKEQYVIIDVNGNQLLSKRFDSAYEARNFTWPSHQIKALITGSVYDYNGNYIKGGV